VSSALFGRSQEAERDQGDEEEGRSRIFLAAVQVHRGREEEDYEGPITDSPFLSIIGVDTIGRAGRNDGQPEHLLPAGIRLSIVRTARFTTEPACANDDADVHVLTAYLSSHGTERVGF